MGQTKAAYYEITMERRKNIPVGNSPRQRGKLLRQYEGLLRVLGRRVGAGRDERKRLRESSHMVWAAWSVVLAVRRFGTHEIGKEKKKTFCDLDLSCLLLPFYFLAPALHDGRWGHDADKGRI